MKSAHKERCYSSSCGLKRKVKEEEGAEVKEEIGEYLIHVLNLIPLPGKIIGKSSYTHCNPSGGRIRGWRVRVGIAGTEIVIQRGPLDFDLKENKLSTERGERESKWGSRGHVGGSSGRRVWLWINFKRLSTTKAIKGMLINIRDSRSVKEWQGGN